ncbi:DivIVA domain-containing protein [Tindallia californiensis]|uniref:Cell division initiation protein n=1 Tax=Tindallia californiensis TaxID=159292 RepID=A0A1H3JMT3_9FIRM|nr:DivIVA domain-containing protein [Tindallia californiensis]SDY41232.1 cell division initiation protein [Tindallia californiensis]
MITPLDIQNKEFKKSVRGYNEAEVDAFLDEIMADYEVLYKENLEMKEKLEIDEKQVEKYKQMEDTLKETLVVAQSTAEELRVNAMKKSDVIIQEAELKAKGIMNEAKAEVDKLYQQHDEMLRQLQIFKTRYRTLLQSQMDSLLVDATSLADELSTQKTPPPKNEKGDKILSEDRREVAE